MAISSGEVPDVAKLVREAREASKDNLQYLALNRERYGEIVKVHATRLELVIKRELHLCDALEEREREVERLRWFYENMRDADRRNLQMEYEVTRRGVPRREERDG